MAAKTAEPIPAQDERGTVLAAFARALRREMHNLRERPEILWQQLYNRLQWEEEEPVQLVLRPAFEARSRAGATPWLRTRTPFHESTALLSVMAGHRETVNDCAFSSDGSLVVSASDDGTLRLWDPASGRELRTLEGRYTGRFEACALSPDGSLVASASANGSLTLWDAVSGREVRSLDTWSHCVNDCAFSPDGTLVASAEDETLKLWDTATGRKLRTLEGHTGRLDTRLASDTDAVTACAFSPDGTLVVSASRDGTLKLWDSVSGRELRTLEGHTDWVEACAFSPDGTLVVSASLDGTLRLWDPVSGRELRKLEGHAGSVMACAFSPDGTLVVSADRMTLKLWDVASGRELRTLEGHTGSVTACAFSPDGRFIVSASWDGTLRLWDAVSGRELRTLPLLGPLHCVATHPRLLRAVCGDEGGGVHLVDLAGIECGPVIVTALDRGDAPRVHCPACFEESPLEMDWLGEAVDCPRPVCEGRMRVNPFVAKKLKLTQRWAFWRRHWEQTY